MYWIKRFALLILLAISLSGCAEIAKGIIVSALPDKRGVGWGMRGERIYMENIDNAEFLEFVLENNIIEGLKREDVIYVDNLLEYMENQNRSYKILLAKDEAYLLPSNATNLDKFERKHMDAEANNKKNNDRSVLSDFLFNRRLKAYRNTYVAPEYIMWAEIRTSDNSFCKEDKSFIDCDILHIYYEKRGEVKWYQTKTLDIIHEAPHCYNDIHKIKAIIDERVAYFLSLENNQTNATSVDQ